MRALIALCLTLAVVSQSEAHFWRPRPPQNVNVGDSCTPPHVATCGPRRVVSQNITAAADFG